MSKYMLCDRDAINDVNPFVSRDFSLPGGVRQLGEFADRSLVKEKSGMEVQEEKSPYCDYALTSGWRTNEMCRPQGNMCVDERPFIPQLNIDRGFTVDRPASPRVIETTRRRRRGIVAAVVILLVLILLLILRR